MVVVSMTGIIVPGKLRILALIWFGTSSSRMFPVGEDQETTTMELAAKSLSFVAGKRPADGALLHEPNGAVVYVMRRAG